MSRKQKGRQGKNLKSERFQRLRKAVHNARTFLSKRYVYSGLLGGFLWMFSAPLVITALLGSLDESSLWVVRLAFFPLILSSLLIDTIIAGSASYPRIWLVIFGFSFLISMLLGLSITYSIHKFRKRTKKTQLTPNLERSRSKADKEIRVSDA
jgi:hypothetical protein